LTKTVIVRLKNFYFRSKLIFQAARLEKRAAVQRALVLIESVLVLSPGQNKQIGGEGRLETLRAVVASFSLCKSDFHTKLNLHGALSEQEAPLFSLFTRRRENYHQSCKSFDGGCRRHFPSGECV
jgi:hypothetical protein